jgi:SAM-dependent methyltransferase
MNDYNAYHTAELAEIYDAVYGDRDDHVFWRALASDPSAGPILELACGTGRVLIPLARAGHEIVGLDLSPQMLERCRAKLAAEAPEVQRRVRLVQSDMTSFDLEGRFSLITSPFRGFQHLMSVEQQLACLGRCHAHLQAAGKLVLDLFHPDPALLYDHGEADGERDAEIVQRPGGGSIRWWGRILAYRRSRQYNQCEMVYEITEPDGSRRTVTEQFPMRYLSRFEVEHLLARAGFAVVAVYGDYDRSPLDDSSPEMIVVAEPLG